VTYRRLSSSVAYGTGILRALRLCMEVVPLRTTVDIDERLLEEVMQLLNVRTKREAVQRSLEALIRQARRQRLQAKLGRVDLDITLDELHKLRSDEC